MFQSLVFLTNIEWNSHIKTLSHGTLLSFLKDQHFRVSISVTVFKSVSHKKGIGTYLLYFYWLVAQVKTVAHTWSILMGGAWWLVTLVAPLGGCCATQTLSAKPLRLSHLYFASKLLYFYTIDSILSPAEKCLWLLSCFSPKHCWYFKGLPLVWIE